MTELHENRQRSNTKTYAEVVRTFIGPYLNLPRRLNEVKRRPVPKEVIDSYNENREVLERIYGKDKLNDLFYHGTGAIQYAGGKYTEGTKGEFRHPLDAILKEGLNPHHDVWNMSPDGIHSSSLATTWPYGKAYADLHQSPQDPLKWEYGRNSDWIAYALSNTGNVLLRNAVQVRHPIRSIQNLREIKRNLWGFTNKKVEGDERLGKLQKWISYVRRVSPEDKVKDVLLERTDIANNFGAVITLDPNRTTVVPRGPGVYEVRTQDSIPPESFLSLAVPLNKVEEYREKIKALGYDFPTLPIEEVDYHMSRFSFEELTEKRRIPVRQAPPK